VCSIPKGTHQVPPYNSKAFTGNWVNQHVKLSLKVDDGDHVTSQMLKMPAASITGEAVSVFDWRTQHCPGLRGVFETKGRCPNDVALGCDPDVTDAPMKAYRNGSGVVVLQAPLELGARAMVGPSLSKLHHDCHIYANSTAKMSWDPALNACREWNQSPYAFKNNSVYALTHMEYHNESNHIGLWSSVTLLKSLDGGQSWKHALPPPRHIVAAAPYKYEKSGLRSVLFGFRSPSNIIKSRTDSFYYATVEAGWGHGPNAVGQEDGTYIRLSDVDVIP